LIQWFFYLKNISKKTGCKMRQKNSSYQSIDNYFIRNTIGLSSAEFFWGLALPVLFESAFLQIFLKQIGASNKIVGLIPAILAAGIMLFSLMSAWMTSHLIHKKRAVILSHMAASIPFLLFGIALPYIDSSHRIIIFLIAYIAFAFTLGITLPLWQNFIVKIFTPANTLKANSIMMTAQIFARLIGSFFIFKSVEKYSFSVESASIIFISAGIMFFTGSFFFILTHEPAGSTDGLRLKPHNFKTMKAAADHILRNRNYLRYLAGTIESFATVSVLSFYANYAVEFKGIEKGIAAGGFLACIYSAGVLTNIFLGWLNFFTLKTKFLIARTAAVAGSVILIFSNTLPLFLLVSFIMGISRGVNQSANAPAVKLLSGLEDATDYFAISAIIIFPLSFSIPLISGVIIDALSAYGGVSYIAVFIILAFIQSTGLIFTILTDFRPEFTLND
jgi:MFS family permease